MPRKTIKRRFKLPPRPASPATRGATTFLLRCGLMVLSQRAKWTGSISGFTMDMGLACIDTVPGLSRHISSGAAVP